MLMLGCEVNFAYFFVRHVVKDSFCALVLVWIVFYNVMVKAFIESRLAIGSASNLFKNYLERAM